jgi:hypothetical protein
MKPLAAAEEQILRRLPEAGRVFCFLGKAFIKTLPGRSPMSKICAS